MKMPVWPEGSEGRSVGKVNVGLKGLCKDLEVTLCEFGAYAGFEQRGDKIWPFKCSL